MCPAAVIAGSKPSLASSTLSRQSLGPGVLRRMISSRDRRSFLRWLAVSVVACCVQVPASGARADTAAYRLGTGDKVRVTVYNEKDLSGDFDVNDQGLIALPLLGQVQVRGLTISEAQELITE